MTDVDIEHVKYQLSLVLEQTPGDLKQALETLFTQHPGEVLSALTDGQVKEAGETATIHAWVGASEDGSFGAMGRRPVPAVTGAPTWAPHHPSKSEDVVVTWEETNLGADLGAYTDLVEVYIDDGSGEEKLKEIRIDCDKLGGAGSETVTRAVTLSAPRDGRLIVTITINEDGSSDPTTATAQGRKFGTRATFLVGGADEKPTHGDHPVGIDLTAAQSAISQATESLATFGANEEGGELAAQQFGAGLYLVSYLTEAFPPAADGESTPELDRLKQLAHWLYDKGSELYADGKNPMFDRGQRLFETKDLARDLYAFYTSITTQVSALRDSPELACAQIKVTFDGIRSMVERAFA